MKTIQKYVFASIVLCLTTLTAQGGFHYQFSPAGNFPGATYTVPLNISLSHIVGYYVTPLVNHAYIQTNGSFVDATPYGALVSYLSGINSHGIAVGGYCPQGCNPYVGQYGYAYEFKTGKIQTIQYPMAGAFQFPQ